MSVERTQTINAPAHVVFDQVNDFHNWNDWSPWLDHDTEAEITYDGPDRGEGAIFEWSGNEDVGAGRMTITESRENEYIEMKLEFIEPYESTSTTGFDFQAVDESTTRVSWSMSADHTWMSSVMGVFMDIEGMIGSDYEQGLKQLDRSSRNAFRSETSGRESTDDPEPENTEQGTGDGGTDG